MKTLEGKVAGLQDAKALRDENEKYRQREEEMFRKMAKEYKPDSEAVVRDRKTGRQRNVQVDAEKEKERLRKEEERKAVYDRWGKGLKQIEDYKERHAEEQYEQSKPLARYSDDKDLDEHLKQQSRDGDPMAEYFRKKNKDSQSGPCKLIPLDYFSKIVNVCIEFQRNRFIKDRFPITASTFVRAIAGMA